MEKGPGNISTNSNVSSSGRDAHHLWALSFGSSGSNYYILGLSFMAPNIYFCQMLVLVDLFLMLVRSSWRYFNFTVSNIPIYLKETGIFYLRLNIEKLTEFSVIQFSPGPFRIFKEEFFKSLCFALKPYNISMCRINNLMVIRVKWMLFTLELSPILSINILF